MILSGLFVLSVITNHNIADCEHTLSYQFIRYIQLMLTLHERY